MRTAKLNKRNVIALLCLLILFYFLYPDSNNDKKLYDTKKELETRSFLEPLCVDIASDETPTILNERMEILTKVNYSDELSLKNFCKPYVYTKLFLKLGSQVTDDCDPLATKRGTRCVWYHMCVWSIEEDELISKMIQEGKIWDPLLTYYFIDYAKDKKTGIVIDAGANIGHFTILAAMLGHHVISFEPIPQHIEIIKRSLALNGVSDRVHLFRNGLSDYFSKTYINVHKNNKGGSTIESIGASTDETINDDRFLPGGRIPIHLVTMDSVIPLVTEKYPDYKILFWKADVEGYESRMFRGSWRFLSRYQPIISFEVLGKSFARTKCDLPQLFYGLLNLNYTIDVGNGNGLLKRESVKEFSNNLVVNQGNCELILNPIGDM